MASSAAASKLTVSSAPAATNTRISPSAAARSVCADRLATMSTPIASAIGSTRPATADPGPFGPPEPSPPHRLPPSHRRRVDPGAVRGPPPPPRRGPDDGPASRRNRRVSRSRQPATGRRRPASPTAPEPRSAAPGTHRRPTGRRHRHRRSRQPDTCRHDCSRRRSPRRPLRWSSQTQSRPTNKQQECGAASAAWRWSRPTGSPARTCGAPRDRSADRADGVASTTTGVDGAMGSGRPSRPGRAAAIRTRHSTPEAPGLPRCPCG